MDLLEIVIVVASLAPCQGDSILVGRRPLELQTHGNAVARGHHALAAEGAAPFGHRPTASPANNAWLYPKEEKLSRIMKHLDQVGWTEEALEAHGSFASLKHRSLAPHSPISSASSERRPLAPQLYNLNAQGQKFPTNIQKMQHLDQLERRPLVPPPHNAMTKDAKLSRIMQHLDQFPSTDNEAVSDLDTHGSFASLSLGSSAAQPQRGITSSEHQPVATPAQNAMTQHTDAFGEQDIDGSLEQRSSDAQPSGGIDVVTKKMKLSALLQHLDQFASMDEDEVDLDTHGSVPFFEVGSSAAQTQKSIASSERHPTPKNFTSKNDQLYKVMQSPQNGSTDREATNAFETDGIIASLDHDSSAEQTQWMSRQMEGISETMQRLGRGGWTDTEDSSSLQACPGFGTTCDQDENHRVCAQLLEAKGRPLELHTSKHARDSDSTKDGDWSNEIKKNMVGMLVNGLELQLMCKVI